MGQLSQSANPDISALSEILGYVVPLTQFLSKDIRFE